MSTGKHACFNCRKIFAQQYAGGALSHYMTSEQRVGKSKAQEQANAKSKLICPSCSGRLVFVGIDFKTPKTSDVRAWMAAEQQFSK